MAPAPALDDRVLQFVAEHRSPWMTTFSETLMDIGSIRNLAIAMLFGVVVAVALHQWRVAAAVVLAVVTASIAVGVLKELFGFERPPWELSLVEAPGYAFPSGEAARTSAAVAAFVVAFSWSSRRLMLACVAVLSAGLLLVGVCMVYLGAHWTSDVLAGWVLGAAIGCGFGLLFRRRGVAERPSATGSAPAGATA